MTETTVRTTRAQRMAMPLAREVVKELAVEHAAALGWLDRASLPLVELEKPRNVRLALDALTQGGRAGGPARGC